MYAHLTFTNSSYSNCYIATTNAKFFEILCKYNVNQTGRLFFDATPRASRATTYREKQAILRDFAILWQGGNFDYSYSDLAAWGDFFETYGRKYGLLTEFHNNAIL